MTSSVNVLPSRLRYVAVAGFSWKDSAPGLF